MSDPAAIEESARDPIGANAQPEGGDKAAVASSAAPLGDDQILSEVFVDSVSAAIGSADAKHGARVDREFAPCRFGGPSWRVKLRTAPGADFPPRGRAAARKHWPSLIRI